MGQSIVYINIHVVNKIAAETITPDKIKDSKNAKMSISNQANSAFISKKFSRFSNMTYYYSFIRRKVYT